MSVASSIAESTSMGHKASFTVEEESAQKIRKSLIVLLILEFCFTASLAQDVEKMKIFARSSFNWFYLLVGGSVALLLSFLTSWISDSFMGKFNTLIIIAITSISATGAVTFAYYMQNEVLYQTSVCIHFIIGEVYTISRFAIFLDQVEEPLDPSYSKKIFYDYLFIKVGAKSCFVILNDLIKTFKVDLENIFNIVGILFEAIPTILFIFARKVFVSERVWFRIVDSVFAMELKNIFQKVKCHSRRSNDEVKDTFLAKCLKKMVFAQLLWICTVSACLCSIFTKELLTWRSISIAPDTKFWIVKFVFHKLYHISQIANVVVVRYVIVTYASKVRKNVALHYKIFCLLTVISVIFNVGSALIIRSIESQMFIPLHHIVLYNMNTEMVFYRQVSEMNSQESIIEEWKEIAASSYLKFVFSANTEVKIYIMAWQLAKKIELILNSQLSYVISSTIKEVPEKRITKLHNYPILKIICALEYCNGILIIDSEEMSTILDLPHSTKIGLLANHYNFSFYHNNTNLQANLYQENLNVYSLYSLIVYENQEGRLQISIFLLNQSEMRYELWILPCLYLESLIHVLYLYLVVKYAIENAPKPLRTMFSFFALSGNGMGYLVLLTVQNFKENEMYVYGCLWCISFCIVSWLAYFSVPHLLKIYK